MEWIEQVELGGQWKDKFKCFPGKKYLFNSVACNLSITCRAYS